MVQERLDRRMTILRGKRVGAFDRDQYYLELAQRSRVARKIRTLLRHVRPVVLATPRWGEVRSFLDDVAVDLTLGRPAVHCRTLSLRSLEGKTPYQTWTWLAQAIAEFCGLDQAEHASQVVSRHGFRIVLKELFEAAEHTGRRCLLIHAAEHLHLEALQDFVSVLEDHLHLRIDKPRFNVLVAGSVQSSFEFADVRRLHLPDYDRLEAFEALVERLGPTEAATLDAVQARVGGVPALVETLAARPIEALRDVISDPRAMWQALGSLGHEIRRAFDILASDSELSARLEQLADDGPQPLEPVRDDRLVHAGLVKIQGTVRPVATFRAPLFRDLAAP